MVAGFLSFLLPNIMNLLVWARVYGAFVMTMVLMPASAGAGADVDFTLICTRT